MQVRVREEAVDVHLAGGGGVSAERQLIPGGAGGGGCGCGCGWTGTWQEGDYIYDDEVMA